MSGLEFYVVEIFNCYIDELPTNHMLRMEIANKTTWQVLSLIPANGENSLVAISLFGL
jgi:PhoPQ-activated pathogenicity-related protein